MTREDIAGFAEPGGFRPFAIVTQGGLRMEVPHPEFIAVPPEGASYVIVFTMHFSREREFPVPKFIDLGAIDHIDWEVKA